jgi:hypothetical protein
VTSNDFRKLALKLPEVVESAHMGHPDLRVKGKIFATLGYPAAGWGVVKLTPDQQLQFMQAEPGVFLPVKGAWGMRGNTSVHLASASKESVRSALLAAWRNVAPKRLAQEHEIDE